MSIIFLKRLLSNGKIKYRELVKKTINKYGQYKPKYGDVEVQKIFDLEGYHYKLMNVSWHGNRRLRRCVLQIDLKVV